jgi:hypothetical protein
MTSKPETLAELKAELAEVDARLTELRSLTAKRARIASLIRQWEALFESGRKKQRRPHPMAAETSKPFDGKESRGSSSGDYAEAAILSKGPLPIASLVDEMRVIGWTGSGDDATDRKRVYVALYNRGKSKRFVLEKGLWKLKKSEPGTTSSHS